ncbi:PfkB family carbohydrate kinase [Micromonospora yasonensis]|uniref:PfkB family carbohydrate kinase n=1 Tax=Micromonospora yasonensis TaxID=1128667 RepID=UPI00223018B2|nr:PfkB family carbohydrate kinase [Micromonospora yasonensis]MCW3839577.1 PfkB family carbohydrate kinase [Micromonospora yasonensis]
MIITVTLNAALDITYEVPDLVPNASHRVSAVRQRAGGKGINVASVLSAFGVPVTATGLAGGGIGADIRADLDARAVRHAAAAARADAPSTSSPPRRVTRRSSTSQAPRCPRASGGYSCRCWIS